MDYLGNMTEHDTQAAQTLRALLESRGIQQPELAAQLGVTQPTVSRWLTCKRRPPLWALIAIADLLWISLDDLVGRNGRTGT